MSPEQTRGEPLDARTDVWSFGALLYEMLAGRRPFAADDDAVVIHAIRHDDPPALDGLRTGVPETAARLVERCLRKDPADRFPDARGLVTALDSDPAQPGPHGLFSELRRRHVFRVVAVYGATAFVVLQLADIVFPALGLPAWSLSLVLALLVVGFPLAVVLAWAFELTPQGVRRTPPEIPADPRSAGPRPGRNRAATAIALLAGVTALGVLGWAGARWLDRPAAERNDPAPAMDSADGMPVPDPQRVAVLPFSSPPDDDELNRLGRDLVITLAPALDGLGDLRTVDGTTIAAHVASRQPLQATSEGLDLARQLGAGRVVRGSLVRADQTGTDETVRADVAVIATESGEAEARITVEAPDGNIGVLTDSITLALVRSLWPSDRLPSFETGALSTRSVPAMRAFLEGELATAEGRWRDAPDHFARAFEIDSTFWLAGARYLDAMAYRSRPVDPALAGRIWEHRDALPERQRALMEAGRADSLSQRLAQARDLTERYPDSWRAWFGLADQLMHNGLFLGATQDEARAAMERAVALNPTSSTLWQHLFWMALADRDTAATGGAIRHLRELGADSASVAEVGLDQVRFFRLLQGLAATGDAPDRAATDTLARQLVGYVGPLDLSRVGGEVLAYGFPRGETVLEEVTLSLPVSASARRGALRSLAEALAARGAWDSALVVLDEYVASASGSEPIHDAWRIAAIGRWLGALEPAAGAGWREALARAPGLDLPARAEITWLDGIVASRDDSAGLSEARAGLGRLAAEVAPGSVDSVTVAFLDRSLAALERADRGQIAAAADAMLALERERAEHIWFRRTGDSHPYLTAVNRLSAARWLQETERAAEAEALLRWHESVQFPAWRHARADATLRGVIEFRRARVSEAVGRDAAAREHDARALEVLDLAEGTLASMVDSAQAALGL